MLGLKRGESKIFKPVVACKSEEQRDVFIGEGSCISMDLFGKKRDLGGCLNLVGRRRKSGNCRCVAILKG